MKCNYCGKDVVFMSSKKFYGKDYGSNVYSCKPCGAYVGTHGNTSKPLGTLAKAGLRKLRNEAHSLFDPLWKSGKMSRSSAYKYLSNIMFLPAKDTHIGMFDEDDCLYLIAKLKEASYA